LVRASSSLGGSFRFSFSTHDGDQPTDRFLSRRRDIVLLDHPGIKRCELIGLQPHRNNSKRIKKQLVCPDQNRHKPGKPEGRCGQGAAGRNEAAPIRYVAELVGADTDS
jgi:hypothetical protein